MRTEDFWAKAILLFPGNAELAEVELLSMYDPLWNTVIQGFGNNPLGAGRQEASIASDWDILHPGRAGAGGQEGTPLAKIHASVRKNFEERRVFDFGI